MFIKIFFATLLNSICVYGSCGQTNVKYKGDVNIVSLISMTSHNNEYNILNIVRENDVFTSYQSSYSNMFGYIAIDVCNKQDVLVESLLYVILDIETKAIVSHMPFDMTKLAASIILSLFIPYFALAEQVIYPDSINLNLYNVFSYDIDSVSLVTRLTQGLMANNISYVTFLSLCDVNSDCNSIMDNHYWAALTQTSKICVQKANILINNTTTIKKAIHGLKNENRRVIFLLADYKYIINLKYIARSLNFTNFYSRLASAFRGERCVNINDSFVYKTFMPVFQCQMYKYLDNETGWINLLGYFIQTLHKHTDFIKARLEHKYSEELFQKNYYEFHMARVHKPFCEKPVCRKGKELYFGRYKTDTLWIRYGWHCRPCLNNTIKETIGNLICTPCPKEWKSNKLKTTCYDPYTNTLLSENSTIGIVFITICTLLCTLTVLTLLIFYKYRNTPVVLSSNKHMSFLQLTLHGTLFVTLPVLFIGIPINQTCTLRPIVIGICLTTSTTITLCKAQKLLFIFQAKVKMTETQIFMTKAVEIFLLLLMLLIDGAIIIVSFMNYPSSLLMLLFSETMSREIYCSTNQHIQYQFAYIFAYIFALFLFNTIQGFRARKLPDNFRETSFITISSFLSSVFLSFLTLVYYSQTSEHSKSTIIAFTSFSLNAINAFCLYCYRVFIILFKPEINNSEYFQKERMGNVAKHSRVQLQHDKITTDVADTN